MSSAGPRAEPYPRFSDGEMAARRASLEAVMHAHGVGHVVVYGADRSGSAVAWLTRWPVTREALVVASPGERDLLLVNFYNHVPNAQRMATEAEVRWGGDVIATALDELDRRGARGRRIGAIGPLAARAHERLAAFAAEIVDLNPAYTGLRLVKSAEELEWLRVGVAMTDAAMRALRDEAGVGVSEHELGNIVERAYVGRGGATHIHYFGITSMSDPRLGVPAQWPAARRLRRGDVLSCEISASFWGYTGQLLRTFAVADEVTPLFRGLHDVADAAFDAVFSAIRPGIGAGALVDAASVIEEAGFTTRDDLVHGFVGGYLPPVVGSRSRTLEPVPELALAPGMTIVVQPNVVTRDERAGVQTGELVLVGAEGAERLHDDERGLGRLG
jgi:Xaa-Pro dipeptidase